MATTATSSAISRFEADGLRATLTTRRCNGDSTARHCKQTPNHPWGWIMFDGGRRGEVLRRLLHLRACFLHGGSGVQARHLPTHVPPPVYPTLLPEPDAFTLQEEGAQPSGPAPSFDGPTIRPDGGPALTSDSPTLCNARPLPATHSQLQHVRLSSSPSGPALPTLLIHRYRPTSAPSPFNRGESMRRLAGNSSKRLVAFREFRTNTSMHAAPAPQDLPTSLYSPNTSTRSLHAFTARRFAPDDGPTLFQFYTLGPATASRFDHHGIARPLRRLSCERGAIISCDARRGRHASGRPTSRLGTPRQHRRM